MDQYDWIFEALSAFDEYHPSEMPAPASNANGVPFGERVGDDFNARANWVDILEPKGWRIVGRSGDKVYWARPGKEERGWSATTGFCRSERGGDLLFVFSSNADPFEQEEAYSKFTAYAILWCERDFGRAAKTLAETGWGPEPPVLILDGKRSAKPEAARSDTIVRLLASELRRVAPADKWLLKGLVPAEMATIFSALPKAGKTTWLSHLLLACADDGAFCQQEVKRARVLYVTEESETIWAERRDKLGLADHCEFVLRPFRLKPNFSQWSEFLKRFADSVAARPVELVVFDTLAKLWPVENENDASEVTAALMPLLELGYGQRLTLLLVHHLRKTEGLESTGTRGSGGITAAVDSILELRRYNAKDRKDRRRVLQCDARYEDKVDELVVELSPDGLSYSSQGERSDVKRGDLVNVLLALLPNASPGWTEKEIEEAWPSDEAPRRDSLLRALAHGAEVGLWQRDGEGLRGKPSQTLKLMCECRPATGPPRTFPEGSVQSRFSERLVSDASARLRPVQVRRP